MQYSQPRREDEPGVHFDAPGHLEVALLERLGVGRGRGFLSLRADRVFAGLYRGPRRLGCCSRSGGHGNLRPGQIERAWPVTGVASLSPSACRLARDGTACVIRPERAPGCVGSGAEESAGTRGGLRCIGPMVLSNGSMSHLRNRADRRRCRIQSRARRTARGRQSLNLLFLPSRRYHPRPLINIPFPPE